jgi:BCD family chlorophyll transporter-like MFS transporter
MLMTQKLSYSPDTLQNLFLVAGMVMGSLWFFSLLGEEKRARAALAAEQGALSADSPTAQGEAKSSAWRDLKLVWDVHPLRYFCIYLSLSMFFAFSQDLILEPFAGEVFGMSAATTSRFSAYWGSMAILGTLVFLYLSRRYKRLTNTVLSYAGVAVLAVTFMVFALSSMAQIRGLVTPGLILLGIGLGIWNVGTLGLMMDMSPLKRAGTFLGFWTLVVTLARGFGVSFGGIGRDLFLGVSGSLPIAYGIVFLIGGIGLAVSYWALTQVYVKDTALANTTRQDAAAIFAGGLD